MNSTALTHNNSADVTSASALIPLIFRPAATVANCIVYNPTLAQIFHCHAAGTIQIVQTNESSGVVNNSTDFGCSMSWAKDWS